MKITRYQALVSGDLFAIAVVTVIGFATHNETGLEFLPRMSATFISLAVSWFAAASVFKLFEPAITCDPRQLWRPLAALVFAGPLATVLRGFWLNTVVIPIFALVLTATSALGMLIWRSVWVWFVKRKA